MQTSRAFRLAGLVDQESRIYRSLLELGPSTVAAIARNAQLHRPVVYKYLALLGQKGLVGQTKKKKTTLYVAESPDKLNYMFDTLSAEFKDAVDSLKILQMKDGQPIVKYYEGKSGIRGVFRDMVTSLQRGDIFYRYSSSRDGKMAESYLPKDYRDIRDKKQLERFVISNAKRAATKKPRMERGMRLFPPDFDLFEDNITLLMWHDTVAYIDYNTDTATVIKNSLIAQFQIKLFRLLYSRL